MNERFAAVHLKGDLPFDLPVGEPLTWQPETWYHSIPLRRLARGGGAWEISHEKACPRSRQSKLYDARIMPPEAAAELDRIDAEIAALQTARRSFLVNHFREWPVANATNLPERRLGGFATLAEAKAALKAKAVPA